MAKASEIIEPHPTWKIHDPSKIQTFLSCPRKYWYEYVMGWRLDQPNIHFIFGESFHLAKDRVLVDGFSNESIRQAYEDFLECFRREIPESLDDVYAPKNPSAVVPALIDYANRYQNDNVRLVFADGKPMIEIAGTVSVGEDQQGNHRVIHFRLDSVLADEFDAYFFRDTKTGSRLSNEWRAQWLLSFQMRSYLHVLHCWIPKDAKLRGGQVDGTFFYKNVKTPFDHCRVEINKTNDQMSDWLFEVNDVMDSIDNEFERMLECSTEDDYMAAFPKNPTACTQYGLCQFHAFCTAWSNPLKRCETVPVGYKVDRWNPAEKEKTAKQVIHVG